MSLPDSDICEEKSNQYSEYDQSTWEDQADIIKEKERKKQINQCEEEHEKYIDIYEEINYFEENSQYYEHDQPTWEDLEHKIIEKQKRKDEAQGKKEETGGKEDIEYKDVEKECEEGECAEDEECIDDREKEIKRNKKKEEHDIYEEINYFEENSQYYEHDQPTWEDLEHIIIEKQKQKEKAQRKEEDSDCKNDSDDGKEYEENECEEDGKGVDNREKEITKNKKKEGLKHDIYEENRQCYEHDQPTCGDLEPILREKRKREKESTEESEDDSIIKIQTQHKYEEEELQSITIGNMRMNEQQWQQYSKKGEYSTVINSDIYAQTPDVYCDSQELHAASTDVDGESQQEEVITEEDDEEEFKPFYFQESDLPDWGYVDYTLKHEEEFSEMTMIQKIQKRRKLEEGDDCDKYKHIVEDTQYLEHQSTIGEGEFSEMTMMQKIQKRRILEEEDGYDLYKEIVDDTHNIEHEQPMTEELELREKQNRVIGDQREEEDNECEYHSIRELQKQHKLQENDFQSIRIGKQRMEKDEDEDTMNNIYSTAINSAESQDIYSKSQDVDYESVYAESQDIDG